MRKHQKGFSLIELLIVVAIILIIAAIAIPNLIRSKLAANEASAAQTLRTYVSGLAHYNLQCNNSFPAAVGLLGASAAQTCAAGTGDVDPVLATDPANKNGYTFTYTAGALVNGSINTYGIQAVPNVAGTTGIRHFCVDQSGVVRALEGAACVLPAADGTGGSPPLQ